MQVAHCSLPHHASQLIWQRTSSHVTALNRACHLHSIRQWSTGAFDMKLQFFGPLFISYVTKHRSTGIPVPHFLTIHSLLTTQCVTRAAVLRNNGCATTSESIKECEKEYEIKRIVGKYSCCHTRTDIKHKRLQIQYARAGRHVSTTRNFWRGQRLWTVA